MKFKLLSLIVIFSFICNLTIAQAVKHSSANIDLKKSPVVLGECPENEAIIVKLPNDDLKIFYIAKSKTQMHSISSSDNGKSWSEPVNEFDLPGNAYYALQVLLDDDNELQCIFHIRGEGDNGYRGRHYNLWHCKTSDGRKIWSKPVEFYNGYVGSIRGFIQLPSGRLLVSVAVAIPARMQKPEQGIDYGWHDVVTFYSDDDGKSWEKSGSILRVEQDNDRGLTRYGIIEPHLTLLNDGTVWMLSRTKNGFLYESYSKDQGLSWSKAVKTKFISSDSPAQIQRLSDGRLILLINICQKWDDLKSYAIGGREVLHAAISDNEGKSWHGFREIMYAPDIEVARGDRGTAYASTAQMSDGRVIVVGGQGEGQRSIVAFDPSWLDEVSVNDDFSGEKYWTSYGSPNTNIVELSEATGGKALYVGDSNQDQVCGMVYNLPMMKEGKIKLRIKPLGVSIDAALTDHFSVVNDSLANENGIFPFKIDLEPNKWNEIVLEFDSQSVQINIVGKKTKTVDASRSMVWGVNYLRLIGESEKQPSAFYVDKLEITNLQ